MKTVTFLVSSTPDNPEIGYGDHWQIENDGQIICGGHGSTCPNPYRVTPDGLHAQPWTVLYGWIADGEHVAKCVMHDKYGKCLLINYGLQVPSRVPNPRHGGQMILEQLFVHSGGLGSKNAQWRASMGCCTVAPGEWSGFMDQFEVGESVKLIIKPLIHK